MIVLDRLPLAAGLELLVVDDGSGHPRALPWRAEEDRRAVPGERASEALVRLLTGGSRQLGRFRITSWLTEAPALAGERRVGVDQTNDSVVVGERAVVKWMRAVEPGPHPAPLMLRLLTSHGFAGIPQPWGLVEWQPEDEVAARLLVTVDSLLPDAVDGWTWAVDDVREAVTSGSTTVVWDSGARVGVLVAEMHAALVGSGRPATEADVATWSRVADADLDRALDVTTGPARTLLAPRADVLRRAVRPPDGLVGAPLIPVHGDLHVGQVLRADGTYVVTDFDGNPVAPPGDRTAPQPPAVDVAGMAQSLRHAAYVLRRHEPHHPRDAVRSASDAFVAAFLGAYAARLVELGCGDLHQPALVPALRLRQVCREFVYAAEHLPRWSYVPEAALVDLLPDPDPETP